MACLRQEFEDWAESEPELEKDHPTEEEVAAFEEAEKEYHAKVRRNSGPTDRDRWNPHLTLNCCSSK